MTDLAAPCRPALEVADVFRAHGQAFLDRYGQHLSAGQRRVLKELALCRTAALGGHVEACADCGHQRPAYNSCRNRHCPKCQGAARAAWLAREADLLLPVPYYHVVFTLPAALGPLALQNPAVVYGLLFGVAWDSVRELAADPHYLGTEVGMLAVLHTWGQNLCHHPHLHCVVTGGGLSCDANGRIQDQPCWRACRPGFFLPVKVLSRLFRGKFLAGLRAAHTAGQLACRGRLTHLTEASAFAAWLTPLYQQDWVVYAKAPWGGPEQVLKYLARYTHRVAISNSRLLDLQDGQVTFAYKDYADGHRHKQLTLDASEFIRRFLQHVLPSGFVKMRHYGLLANRWRAVKLQMCRQLLLVVTVATLLFTAAADHSSTATDQPPCCPACGSNRWHVIERQPRPSLIVIGQLPLTADTS